MKDIINNITGALNVKAEDAPEKPPIKPFDKPLKSAPRPGGGKFEYEKYTLVPPDDARKITKTYEAMTDRTARIGVMAETY